MSRMDGKKTQKLRILPWSQEGGTKQSPTGNSVGEKNAGKADRRNRQESSQQKTSSPGRDTEETKTIKEIRRQKNKKHKHKQKQKTQKYPRNTRRARKNILLSRLRNKTQSYKQWNTTQTGRQGQGQRMRHTVKEHRRREMETAIKWNTAIGIISIQTQGDYPKNKTSGPYFTIIDPLRTQSWPQDRRSQSISDGEHSREETNRLKQTEGSGRERSLQGTSSPGRDSEVKKNKERKTNESKMNKQKTTT